MASLLNIESCFVNPHYGYGNQPSVIMMIPGIFPRENRIYKNTEGCYWFQDPESGYTDFFFHCRRNQWKKKEDGSYTTPPYEGYGGREFKIKLHDPELGLIDISVNGPWSGGSYCANQYLPLSTIEVSFYDKTGIHCGIAGHLTWEVVHKHLPKGWRIIDSKPNWPELEYKGQLKNQWSEDTMEELYVQYRKAISS